MNSIVIKRFFFFIVCVFLLCIHTLADSQPEQASKEPLLYVFTNYYPANYINEEGNFEGLFVDIIKEVFENRLNIPVRIEVYPWNRCQAMVEQGEADIITTVPTPNRLKWSIANPDPFWTKQFCLYTWIDHPKIKQMDTVRSAHDLIYFNFSILSYIGNDWADTTFYGTGVTLIEATSVESMFKMLAAKRGDVIIEDPMLMNPSLKSLNIEDKIIKTKGMVEEVPFHFLIGKKSKYFHVAESAFKVLQELKKDGTIDHFIEKYKNPVVLTVN